MEEPTLEELEALEEDLELDLDIEELEDEDYVPEGFESLDALREEEDSYSGDGHYYRSMGVHWDEV